LTKREAKPWRDKYGWEMGAVAYLLEKLVKIMSRLRDIEIKSWSYWSV
jgi:hypothetical protein